MVETTSAVKLNRVAVFRPGRAGDFILTTPLFNAIKEFSPETQLTVITGANGETLEFTYATTSGPLTAVSTRERDATGTLVLKGQVTYGYDAANRLNSVASSATSRDEARRRARQYPIYKLTSARK